jgi:cytochrome P450
VIAELLAADLWAASANTIWAVYWVVALHLQTRKERLGILRAEVDGSRTSWAAAHSSRTPIAEDPAALHTWLVNSTDSTPLLNSAIQETLRFASSAASTRVVIRDTILAGYRLLKGDRIVCLIRVSHMDEEIHEWADQYEPARYMNANVVRIKDGEFVTNHTMPFGGGASMCPGRYAKTA